MSVPVAPAAGALQLAAAAAGAGAAQAHAVGPLHGHHQPAALLLQRRHQGHGPRGTRAYMPCRFRSPTVDASVRDDLTIETTAASSPQARPTRADVATVICIALFERAFLCDHKPTRSNLRSPHSESTPHSRVQSGLPF